MMNFFLGLVAVAGNLLGGVVVYRLDPRAGEHGRAIDAQPRSLHLMLHIGAGFLLSVTVLEMIPSALQSIRPEQIGPPIVLGGYLLLYLIENTVSPHIHTLPQEPSAQGAHTDGHAHSAPAAAAISPQTLYSALVGLTIHSFFDGVAIGSGAVLSKSLGWLLTIAIVLHKLPEGATVASLAMLAGFGRRAAIVVPLILGGATVAGVFFVAILNPHYVGAALGLAAGVTLYIAASDLVPHARAARTARNDALLLFIGVALFVLTDFLLRRLGSG